MKTWSLAVDDFENFNGFRYKHGIEAVERRWEKCAELIRDYEE